MRGLPSQLISGEGLRGRKGTVGRTHASMIQFTEEVFGQWVACVDESAYTW